MLKIGFNVTSRITPLEPDTKETPVQQQAEEQTVVQPKSTFVNSGPMRSEAMMSSIALRTQLNQQLATQTLEGNHDVVNSESLQHLEQIDRQAPLTQQEAEQQNSLQKPYAYSLMQTLFEAFESVSTERLNEKLGGMDETTRKIVSGLQVKVRVVKDED